MSASNIPEWRDEADRLRAYVRLAADSMTETSRTADFVCINRVAMNNLIACLGKQPVETEGKHET